MADDFINAIASELSSYNDTNNLDWTIIKQDLPSYREWNNAPIVSITPSVKANVRWFSFCGLAIESSYDVFLINQNDLASNFSDKANEFTNIIINLFMASLPASISVAGGFRVRVKPKFDYDRNIYSKAGYQVTCCEVLIHHLV